MAIDFSEEAVADMYSMYEEALEEVKSIAENTVNALVESAMEVKYEPVVKTVEYAINTFYNQDVREGCDKALKNWQDSDSSFSSVMESIKAGDDAIANGQRQEAGIESMIQSWKAMDDGGVASIQTTAVQVKEEQFERINDVVKSGADQLDDLESSYRSRLESQAEENTMYSSIEPVILSSIDVVKTGISALQEQFDKIGEVYSEGDRKAKSNAESFANSVTSSSESLISSGIESLNSHTATLIN